MDPRDDTIRDDRADTQAASAVSGAPASTATGPVAGELGTRYELGAVIGRGGMGEVRLARDTRIDREVAVKLMHGGSARASSDIARFFREARVQGVLEHPAVVPVHDLGIDATGCPYFVMKKLAGTTLADVLAKPPDQRTAWPRRRLLERFIDICLAIELAHERGVIHRDLKPANIMLGDYGEAYVLDWGLARLSDDGTSLDRVLVPRHADTNDDQTQDGALLGTPGYMSPEQARGEPVDARTDVFALGIILYEIVAGAHAMPRGAAALAVTVATPQHRPSARSGDVPPELDDLCARGTDARRDVRPTARALADGVQAYLDGDRDLARRRQLAEQHAMAAQNALGGPDVRRGDAGWRGANDDARATAMREAGRALVLDSTNARAQAVLAAILFDVPDTLPAEAAAAANLERAQARQDSVRKATITYSATTIILLVMVFALPIRRLWPIVLAIVLNAVIAAYTWAMSRRPMPMRSPLYVGFMLLSGGLAAMIGLLFGPLLLMPMFLTGSLSAFLSQPSVHRTVTVVVTHLLPAAVLVGAELAGILPSSFHVVGYDLVITPYAVDFTPMSLLLILPLAYAVQIASAIEVQVNFRRAQERAQERIHAQTWHLKQLLPESRGKPDRG